MASHLLQWLCQGVSDAEDPHPLDVAEKSAKPKEMGPL